MSRSVLCLLSISALALIAATPASNADRARATAKASWEAGRYAEAFEEANEAIQGFGSTPEMEYVRGTSACRIARTDYRRFGSDILLALSISPDVGLKQRAMIAREIRNCQSVATPARQAWYAQNRPRRIGVAGGSHEAPELSRAALTPEEQRDMDAIRDLQHNRPYMSERDIQSRIGDLPSAIEPFVAGSIKGQLLVNERAKIPGVRSGTIPRSVTLPNSRLGQ